MNYECEGTYAEVELRVRGTYVEVELRVPGDIIMLKLNYEFVARDVCGIVSIRILTNGRKDVIIQVKDCCIIRYISWYSI